MAIFRINKERDYTVMSNHHLKDKNLSLKAKGLLSFMLSLPDDWDYSLSGLVAICKESKDAIRNTLNELKRCGYLKITPSRSENGKFEYVYTIYEIPAEIPIKNRNSPNTDNPYTVRPNTENPTQINTNKQSINNKDINDKEDKTNITHNILTNELIELGYIGENEASSFYFDDLFQKYLSDGHTYQNILGGIHYIVPRVIARNFIDENGDEIKNKYGYFKNAIESNFNKLEKMKEQYESGKSLWDDEIKEFSSLYDEGR